MMSIMLRSSVESTTPFQQTDDRDDRALLRAAIEAEREARQVLVDRQNAMARARSLVTSAEGALSEAGEAVAASRTKHAASLAEGLARGSAERSTSSATRAARLAEVDAVDELEAAKDALDRLQADLPDLEENIARAASDVAAAANVVLAEYAAQALAKHRTARAAMRRAQILLQAICEPAGPSFTFTNGSETLRRGEQRAAPLASIAAEVRVMQPVIATNSAQLAEIAAIETGIRAVRQALLHDADAKLPNE